MNEIQFGGTYNKTLFSLFYIFTLCMQGKHDSIVMWAIKLYFRC